MRTGKRGWFSIVCLIFIFSIITISATPLDYDDDGERNDEDCAPNNPSINSYANEICNDKIDNDCDLRIDELDRDCNFDESDSVKLDLETPSSNGFNFLYVVLIVGVILIGVGIFIFVKQKSRQDTNQTQQRPAKVTEEQSPRIIQGEQNLQLAANEQKMKEYVQTILQQGYSKEQIKKALKKKGWPENKIERIFASIGI